MKRSIAESANYQANVAICNACASDFDTHVCHNNLSMAESANYQANVAMCNACASELSIADSANHRASIDRQANIARQCIHERSIAEGANTFVCRLSQIGGRRKRQSEYR